MKMKFEPLLIILTGINLNNNTMKQLLLSIFLVSLIAGCNIFGSDGSNRFGAWEKVSAERGEYRGIEGNTDLQTMGSVDMMAKTIQIDSSYVNSSGRFSLSMSPVTFNNNYTFRLVLTDSSVAYNYRNVVGDYITDSTALEFQVTNSIRNYATGVSEMKFWFTNKCKGIQANEEYLIVDIIGKDSTLHEVVNIRVDGMKKIAKDLVKECKG